VKTIEDPKDIPGVTNPVTIPKLQHAAARCRAWPLWERGTQTVFGQGTVEARVVLVGEQPGNDEDLAGKPFVGPAGRLLDHALAEAGIDRESVYVTNVVKHFKWEARGNRRLHKKPGAREIAACRPWLDAELAALKPEVLICLGATAAQALLGLDFKVSQRHGEWVKSLLADYVIATTHPSAILRAPDDESRHEQMSQFVNDLRVAAQVIV
jgi:uracil-DNA glycosylase